jgi:hypothetical protein
LSALKALGIDKKPKKLDAVLSTGVYRRIGRGRFTYGVFGRPNDDYIPADIPFPPSNAPEVFGLYRKRAV